MLVIPHRPSDCHPDKKHYARGLCRTCYDKQPGRLQKIRANNKRWEERNPDYMAHKWIKITYGISVEEYNQLLKDQNNCCAICGQTGDEHWKPCIDHCHNSKKVRGLLCRNCNVGLGHFSDDPELLKAAARYL